MNKITDYNRNDDRNAIAVTFNTGRQYTEQGQVIAAIVHRGDTNTNTLGIIFCDYSRGITGYIPWFGRFDRASDLADTVMLCYDRGNYTHDHTGIAAVMRSADVGELHNLIEGA